MATKYKVTVQKIDTDVPFKDKEYEKTGVDEDGKDTYGYVYFDSTKDVTTTLFEQTVDSLDMQSLVLNINRQGEQK